jgi:hypothetical protein
MTRLAKLKNYKRIVTTSLHLIFSSEFLLLLTFQSCPLLAFIRSQQSALFFCKAGGFNPQISKEK